MELSIKNSWVDENNRVFIYFTIENIMEIMGGNKKSVKVLSELDTEKGIGLIEKQRQGQGKPTKIYVKNFIVDNLSEMSKGNFKKCRKDKVIILILIILKLVILIKSYLQEKKIID